MCVRNCIHSNGTPLKLSVVCQQELSNSSMPVIFGLLLLYIIIILYICACDAYDDHQYKLIVKTGCWTDPKKTKQSTTLQL